MRRTAGRATVDLVSRRQFLGRALVAGAGATVMELAVPAGFARASSINNPSAIAQAEDSDPNFLAGSVLSYDEVTRSVTVLDPDSQIRTASTNGHTSIWKAGLWNAEPLSIGDCLLARGVTNGDRLALQSVWVDIKNFYGTVNSIGADNFVLATSNHVAFLVGISNLTTLYEQGGPYINSLGHLRPGVAARIIGFGDPVLGTFTATSIWNVSEPVQANGADDETDPTAPTVDGTTVPPTCSYTYYGLASWFCCGGVNGCGSAGCGSSGAGACPGCRSDRQHIAWPNITNAGGAHCISTCGQNGCASNNCSSCPTITRLDCGTSVSLSNPCQSAQTTVFVKDCGPCVHCRPAFGCKGRTHVKFDLAPCAFTALGGSLDSGFVSCNATVQVPC